MGEKDDRFMFLKGGCIYRMRILEYIIILRYIQVGGPCGSMEGT